MRGECPPGQMMPGPELLAPDRGSATASAPAGHRALPSPLFVAAGPTTASLSGFPPPGRTRQEFPPSRKAISGSGGGDLLAYAWRLGWLEYLNYLR
ncbi:hypothetical protein LZ30DRAFT_738196 [Colletotrichum cereale]|nr:hypothetical protein LZ30DRAFT_738196 [Colletotrichum cereale]